MEQDAHPGGRIVSGTLKRLWRAVARMMVESAGPQRDGTLQDSLNLDLVRATGLPLSALGLESAPRRSPAWYRTDLAVYALRYENGWGKAEGEDRVHANSIALLSRDDSEAQAMRDAA